MSWCEINFISYNGDFGAFYFGPLEFQIKFALPAMLDDLKGDLFIIQPSKRSLN